MRQVAAEARKPLDAYDAGVLAKSLPAVFDDLSHRSSEEIARIAEVNWLTAELVRLYSLFRQRIAGKYGDASDMLRLAATVVSEATTPTVAVIVEPPGAFETELFQALNQVGRLRVVTVSTGVDNLDAGIEPWLWGLDPVKQSNETVLAAADAIVIAPDADAEVQVAIAELLRHAEDGVPFARMALLYSSRTPYARIVEDQMRLARIPVRGAGSLTLAQTMAGGFVLRLFDVIETDFSYEAVSAWLLALNNVDAADWLRVARRSRAGGPPEHWVKRLHLYAEELERRNGKSASAVTARGVCRLSLKAWPLAEGRTHHVEGLGRMVASRVREVPR